MRGQTAWCTALLDPAGRSPPDLVTWNGSDPVQRFAVYRNNVTVSLMGAIADTFPVCQALLGAARFRDLARAFVRAQPPRSPVLARYGAGFADFVAAQPSGRRLALPARPGAAGAGLPGRAPRGRRRAPGSSHPGRRHGRAGAAARAAPDARIPASPTLDSPVTRWSRCGRRIKATRRPANVDPDVPESAWVLRHDRSVRVLPMAVGDVRFIAALRHGLTLGEAARALAADGADFDLTRCLTVLLREQVLTGYPRPRPEEMATHEAPCSIAFPAVSPPPLPPRSRGWSASRTA